MIDAAATVGSSDMRLRRTNMNADRNGAWVITDTARDALSALSDSPPS